MNDSMILYTQLEAIASKRSVYQADAYLFVIECLELAMQSQTRRTHLSGGELLEWVRKVANERYGVMSGDVFKSWGVSNTLDFGRIVFHLVDEGLLARQSGDTLGEFIDRFDFEEAFSLKSRAAQG